MNAALRFRDDRTGQVRAVTLVYPGQEDIAAGRLSGAVRRPSAPR